MRQRGVSAAGAARGATGRLGVSAAASTRASVACMSETRQPLLIVEDDPALQKQMQWAFDSYETIVAERSRVGDCAAAALTSRPS